MSQGVQVAKKANGILSSISSSWSAGPGQCLPPLFGTGEAALESRIQFWAPPRRKDIEVLESVQRRATELVKGLGEKSLQEQETELGLFSLEQRRLRGDLIALYHCQEELGRDDLRSLF
ncbi:hypothetical protein HGM15179_010699 [Zosterops borbonicus]|uniref:Uncharacterized protein n=1 Tax=Zosterops borbonicus TaxID=364589 RepID=A0A8K1LJX7_9PASS|nr:hypothetical protein HGM15179_010699 [Zosterops borbonicus]